MAKNLKSANSIIKRNQLIRILKTKGIKRFNKKALEKLEYLLEKKTEIYAELSARRLMIDGRKTLTEKDVISAEEEKLEEFEI